MKSNWKYQYLPCLSLFLGAAGCLLRLAQYRFALDEKGLLITGHPLKWALVLLAVLMVGAVLLPRKEEAPAGPPEGPAWFAGLGALALAAGLLGTTIDRESGTFLVRLCRIVQLAAVAGQLWTGFCRLRKKEAPFAGDALTCLFLCLYLFYQYPYWSGDPHIHHYFFFVAGLLGLAATACAQAAFAAKLGWQRSHFPVALLTAFACLTAIPRAEAPLLLLTGSFWAVFSLYRPAAEPKAPEV